MPSLCPCNDCGVDTLTNDEWYMVHDHIWAQAFSDQPVLVDIGFGGRLKAWDQLPGPQFLCIGCLEVRLGRKLTKKDFDKAPVNNPNEMEMSDRLLDRIRLRS